MRRARLGVALVAALFTPVTALAVTQPASAQSVGYAAAKPSPCGTMSAADGAAHRIDHVVWVVFENKARSRLFQDATKDPYLGDLALACGQATAYHSVPYFPAKLAMTSGQDWGVENDAAAVPGPDLFAQLGTDWLEYMGAMPHNCWAKDTKTYFERHNPALYYADNARACATQDVPLPSSPADIDLSHAFTWVEANVANSMHGCPTGCGDTKLAQLALGDTWAHTWIPALLATPEYHSGSTVIFVVWDQGGSQTASNTPFIVVSPYTTPGSTSSVPYDHYSLLRGTEDLLGLPALGHAADLSTKSVASDFGLPYPAVAAPGPSSG